MNEDIIGIDLGTTNSEVAAYVDGEVRILSPGKSNMLPSCVGLTPDGKLLIGEAARNQALLYPERTIRSVKRLMGSDERLRLGDQEYSPQEVSALILREMVSWARESLGRPIEKAVITVPAYFSDAQRQATREAGQLAGLEVVRILNEPTAASLAYGNDGDEQSTFMVYDLGGGTFDVSIVRMEGTVTEVLASHGNNKLGGDDFDQLLVEHIAAKFKEEHGVNPLEDTHARIRLLHAAEEAKRQLSAEPYVTVREEALITRKGAPCHLSLEITRDTYEAMISPLIESTLESVSKALKDGGIPAGDLDGILLAGGSTRTPMISRVLHERTGLRPRQEVHPDLCVALGAGVLASRLAGHEIDRILVDVSPYSFGISYLGDRDGVEYPYCYHPIIHRNTPLPVTRTEVYTTSHEYQDAARISVFQGDSPDALKNLPVGEFMVEGLQEMEDHNLVLCRMALDIDGILHVTAIEKDTGLSKHVRIENALVEKSEAEIQEGRARLLALFAGMDGIAPLDVEALLEEDGEDSAQPANIIEIHANWKGRHESAQALMARSRALEERMHEDDQEEAIALREAIQDAITSQDDGAFEEAMAALRDLLFFIEGR
jgi:molecular chaperone DnaK (HSP70)